MLIAATGAMVGLGIDVVAWHTSARHDLEPALAAWAHVGPAHRPEPGVPTPPAWSLAVEATAARRVDGDIVRYETVHARADALLGVALGTHATRFLANVGPALTVRAVGVESVAASTSEIRWEPGLRGRIALDGPLSERWGWAWHVGGTSRGTGIDWDAGLGVAWRW